MLRRLHPDQPESFEFTPANLEWATAQIAKYPQGRQASAVIPLLWRAQEQDGWVSKPAIEYVADLLDMAHIRVLEVATFYFMFQLAPRGSVAHVQVCGTTSCMICDAEELIRVCREKIAPHPFEVSADGTLSWEEVECLGACANAPMAQIGKDYYEDLTPERFGDILDAFARGEVPRPGPQNGRFASEPAGGRTSLADTEHAHETNGSVSLALELGDTVKRITGDEPAPRRPEAPAKAPPPPPAAETTEEREVDAVPTAPPVLDAPRDGRADDLKLIKGIGPSLEAKLNEIGIWHYDQIADWGPAEVAWAEERIEALKGRVIRDGWVEQARQMAEVINTPHAQKEVRKD